MFDLLESVLTGDDYLELRFHDRRSRSISVEDGHVEVARSVRHAGVGVRVLCDGAWGFASTSDLTQQALQRAVDAARAIAREAARTRREQAPALRPQTFPNGRHETLATEPLGGHTVEEKIELALKTEALVRGASARVQSASCRYSELIDEKMIVTNDGARVHLLDAKPELRASAVARMEGELQEHTEAEGRTGGLGELFSRRSAEELADKAARTAVDLLRAGYVDGGRKRVILAPDVVGLLIHEAIGHTVEADFVLSGSAAAGKLGQQVASELITLCDSGRSEHEPGAGGTLLVDDEGVDAGRTVIIDAGKLTSYLHNRETAAKFGVEPTGNARAFEYDDEPIIRMRNTYVEPGATPLEQMVGETDDGLLLVGAKNGQADANAEFMFAVAEVYPIVGGKLGPLHRGTTITGDAFEVLRSVDAVGDDFSWQLGSGYCGKGQPAKVDAGGPHLRCEVAVAGKEGT
jgi:TldD protein